MLVFGGAALVSALCVLVVGRLAFDVRLPEQPSGYLLALLLAILAALALGSVSPRCPVRRRSRVRSARRLFSR